MLNKRVALLTAAFPPYRMRLFAALHERISEFKVFVSEPPEPDLYLPADWPVDVSYQHSLALSTSWRHPSGFREPHRLSIPYDTLWALKQFRPDVIISGEMGLRTLQCFIYRNINRQSRLFIWGTVSEENERGRSKSRLALRRLLLPKADGIITNGESGAQYIRRFGVPDKKIARVNQTTNLEPFSAVDLNRTSEQRYRLLYVGQLINRKGLLPFLTALSRWAEAHADRAVELWLAGDGYLQQALMQSPRPANLALRNLGQVAYEDLPAVYAQAGIFALPTLSDEWGLVINEAMAAGLPILGSIYSQAVAELVIEGENGWRFSTDVPAELERALDCALMTPPAGLARMRAAARKRVEHLTPGHMAELMIEAVQ